MPEAAYDKHSDATATVFVVDDEESVRKALARLVRSAGMKAQTFPTAEAFLAEGCTAPASCLVLDVRLPGLNGLQLQEALNRKRYPLAIVFITGHGDVPTSVRAMKAGAVDFLPKPFAGHELLDAIRRAVGRTRNAMAKRAEAAEIQRRYDTLTPRERGSVVGGGWAAQQAGSRRVGCRREDDKDPPRPGHGEDASAVPSGPGSDGRTLGNPGTPDRVAGPV